MQSIRLHISMVRVYVDECETISIIFHNGYDGKVSTTLVSRNPHHINKISLRCLRVDNSRAICAMLAISFYSRSIIFRLTISHLEVDGAVVARGPASRGPLFETCQTTKSCLVDSS